MNLRKAGLDWFRANRGVTGDPIRVSKLYLRKESWTGRPAWWFELPATLVSKPSGYIHLLCQQVGPKGGFHHLRIPKGLFSERRPDLAFREDRGVFSLFLSAEPDSMFRELRGSGKIEFAGFRED